MSIFATSRGSTKKTERFLQKMRDGEVFNLLDQYGREGSRALSNATPVLTGLTAGSWRHEVIKQQGRYSVAWYNQNENQNVNIAIILQYGHGTGTGGYVAGRDYINPVIQPLFDRIAQDVWKAVKQS